VRTTLRYELPMRLVVAALLFLAGCAAHRPAGTPAATPVPPEGTDPAALAIAAALTPALATCPDRVWPGLPGRDLQVLLVDLRGRRALLWNDLREGYRGAPRISGIPFGELPSLYTSGAEYRFGDLHGRPALGFAYDPGADPSGSVEIVIHEAFHRYVQEGWEIPASGVARGIRYPEPWEPRYLRRELVRSLRADVDGTPGALADAAAWLSRIREEFPEALGETRAIDVVEGTAEYAGVLAASVSAVGCGAKETELLAEAARRVRNRWDRPDKEEESYALGVLAGLALRGRGERGWESAAARSPLPELLLARVPPGDPAVDVELAAETKREFQETNRAVREKTGPFLSPPPGETLLVAVPSDWMQGSFGTGGFVSLPSEGGGTERSFILEMTAAFASPASGSRLALKGVTVERSGSPCGAGSFHVFPLPIHAFVEGADRRGTIAEGPVRGEGLEYALVRHAGTAWLCIR
jgi:hypothetical protein